MNDHHRKIEFSTAGTDAQIRAEMDRLAILISSLNKAGVPISLRRDDVAIELTIEAGY